MQKVIRYRGVRLNQRTIDMIEAAEKIAGFKFRLTQGSYNAGAVEKSAGTHDGGGAVDIALKDATTGAVFPKVRREVIRSATRQVGFASWIRDPSQADWPWHCHGIAVGDQDLSEDAADQVAAYFNNRNGLVSNGRDDGPRAWVGMTWEKYHAAHPDAPEEMFTVNQYETLLKAINDQGNLIRQEVRRQRIGSDVYELQTVDEVLSAEKSFDLAFDAAKAAGKTDEVAMADGRAAAARQVQALVAERKAAAAKNG